MQTHFLAEHYWNQKIQLNLINDNDDTEREPEFCRAHAQSDKQNRNGNEESSDVGKKFSQERKHTEHQRWLDADQPKTDADGKSGNTSINGDTTRPGVHLSHHPCEGAARFFLVTIRREREISGDEWLRINEHKDQQQNSEKSAEQAADQTDRRS